MLKGVCVGAGYFSRFQYEAWQRIPEVAITALCNRSLDKGRDLANEFNIPKAYTDFSEMLTTEKPDFLDIITPPETHFDYCKIAADLGIAIIVQKPLAPTQQAAIDLVNYCHAKGVRLMVHENFRFQPWHREIKQLLDNQVIGDLFTLNFRMRMGDGWQPDAYLARQPYFRTMPQLLIYETGVHFIDTFRFLAGDIDNVYAQLKKRNPDIAGEDAGMVFFNFTSGANGLYDANRYNESNAENARYTFGEFLVEGSKGAIRLFNDGKIKVQLLGEKETEHIYNPAKVNFAGDCVFATQRHFIDCLMGNKPFETSGEDYLKNIQVQEAVYASAKENRVVKII
ncbi:MAG: Gfo/Idh/MocA family oxidoreductase [Saprospiraceae bacterium]|nr:Gfo/Idh/MocA family oxidoreductase [Saprospiraceae bacterium]